MISHLNKKLASFSIHHYISLNYDKKLKDQVNIFSYKEVTGGPGKVKIFLIF